jgi:ubiquinone/menaquinone biosynthesis C-methylase UbiE
MLSPPGRIVKKFVRPGQVIADLGAGPGYYTVAFAKGVGESGVVYAVDFDANAIHKLTSKTKKLGLESVVKAYASSASRIDFIPDGAVDFVFAHGLLCCMTDHWGAVTQIKRILNRTGIAYISVTRFARKNDALAVNQDEWENILRGFKIVERNDGIFTRWATLSLS